MKTLKELIQSSEIIDSQVDLNLKVSEIVQDSRLATKSALFIAVKGTLSDGHQFVKEVLNKGSIAVVENDYPSDRADLIIKVASTRNLVGKVASRFFNKPTEHFSLVGITGTNGKTTTAFLLDQIWMQMGLVTGLIGTVQNKIGGEIIPSDLTTPGPIELQGLFHRMEQKKVQVCVMEVSSIALDQARTEGSCFSVGVFTNFTQDHLDYHQTMEQYFNAKLKLFCDYKLPCIVVNIDDSKGVEVLACSKNSQQITFSFHNQRASFYIRDASFKKTGTTANIQTPDGVMALTTPLIGAHNLMNILTALAVIKGLNQDVSLAIKLLEQASGAPGRLERAIVGDGYPNIFVDYAHSDDALENVLKTLVHLGANSPGKIITVLGCGGDRDKTKRPKMAKVASTYSDITIATSDNPRTEDPEIILNDLECGVDQKKTSYHREVNRRKAIYLALSLAKPEDLVLIAGKGHENYQIIGTEKQPFDDKQVVKDYYRS